MHITELNRECLVYLFSFLDKDSRKCLAQTCHDLMAVFQDSSLWPRLYFSSPMELTKKNYILGPALKYLSICWYSSRVKVCNIEDWDKSPLQKSMCSQHQNTVSDFLRGVSERCPNLRTLTLSGCAHVTDETLINILSCCPELRTFKLENCSGMSDRTLAAIPVLAGRLQLLQVNFCRNVTQNRLCQLQQTCPGLSIQAVRSADMIADRIPMKIFKRIPRKLMLR
ncbi:F-box and leucine-rich protein 22 [Pelodytes ibericus]